MRRIAVSVFPTSNLEEAKGKKTRIMDTLKRETSKEVRTWEESTMLTVRGIRKKEPQRFRRRDWGSGDETHER